jgi:hypothetical protein
MLRNASQFVQVVRFLRGLFADENPQVVQLLYEKILPYIHESTFVAGLYHLQSVFGGAIFMLVI